VLCVGEPADELKRKLLAVLLREVVPEQEEEEEEEEKIGNLLVLLE